MTWSVIALAWVPPAAEQDWTTWLVGKAGRWGGGGCLSSRVLAGGAQVWHSQGAPSPRRGAPPSVGSPSLLWQGGPYPVPPPEGTETTFPVLSFGPLSLPYTELENSAGLECVSGSLVDKQNPDSSPPKGGGKGLCCEEARMPGGCVGQAPQVPAFAQRLPVGAFRPWAMSRGTLAPILLAKVGHVANLPAEGP